MSRFCPCCVAVFVIAMATLTDGCSSSSPSPSMPISVSLSPSSPQAIDQSQTVGIKATIENDKSYKGLSWTLTGPGSLSNNSGGLSVIYNSGTTSLTSAQQAAVTAVSVADQTKTASIQITVNPYPQMPLLQTAANGSVDAPYSQMIALTGGTPPFQWGVYDGPIITGWTVSGGVPDGLKMDPNAGTISGTPTGGGTWYFEAMVTDAVGVTVDDPLLSIQINPSAPAANPVPFLNQPLVPTAVSPGSAGFALSVSGTGFVSGVTIDFNNAPLTTTFVDSEHLGASVPAVDVTTAGTASVTVMNPAPGGGRSNSVYFQVEAPEAVIAFANAPNSPLQIPGPAALAVADFNEDGKPDLLISANNRMYVMLGNGDGTFALGSGSPAPIPSPPYDDFPSPYTGSIATGDFNNSGHLGFAVGLLNNEAAAILFGKGDGTFTYSGTLASISGQPTMSLTAADFNGDGNLDLVGVSGINGVSPATLLGYSHGAFNAVAQNLQIYGVSSAAGDFNGDGKLDLVIEGDLVIDGADLLLGNGDGTFTRGSTLNAGTCVTVGDFNGDGKLDLAVCDPAVNSVTILLGDGTGNFTTASGSPIAVGHPPDAIIVGDFDSDGKLDLAVANGDGTVSLLLGNGDGTFAPAWGANYPAGHGAVAIAAADFNGDGKLDLAVANLTDGTISILLQQ